MKVSLSISALLLCAGLFASGCVPYQTYDSLKREYARAKKINDDLRAKYLTAQQELARLNADSKGSGIAASSYQESLRSKDEIISALRRQLDERSELPSHLQFTPDDARSVGGDVELTAPGGISIGEEILFNSGQATLRSSAARQTLDRLANVLKTRYPGEFFHIYGHTDNVPLKKTEKLWKFNIRLGFERAYTVFDYLVNVHSIPEDKMVLHSYGFLKPTDPATQNTKEGRRKNRRVEIYRGGLKL